MAKRIEFDAPDGWVLPEGKAIDDDFEVLATVRMKKGGRLCLVELDGHKMPGYRDDEDDGKTYAQAAADSMDDEGIGQGGY
jgi:hypothetical protein